MNKKYVALAVLTVMTLLIAATGTAMAQQATARAQQETACDHISTFSPMQGPPGTSVSVAGDWAYPNTNVVILWDSSQISSIPADSGGNYSGSFMVPVDAAIGSHDVVVQVPIEGPTENCPYTFTVTAATADTGVQPDAYAQAARTSLPSTGFIMLPAAIAMAAGAGLYTFRKSR